MDKKEKSLYILAGALAGFANGLLGTGGGLAIVPILLGPLKLPPKRAFATSVFIMTPICALSAALYWFQGRASLGHAALSVGRAGRRVALRQIIWKNSRRLAGPDFRPADALWRPSLLFLSRKGENECFCWMYWPRRRPGR